MGIPQIIYIILLAMNLGVALAKHGQPKNTNYNFVAQLIAVIIEAGVLYWGGFFS